VPVEGPPGVVRHVREVLARAATRTVRVAMWGDSLTGADRLPSALRRALQAIYGDAGRGFVLPAAPWPAWNPVDLERCSTGLWRAESERTASARKDGLYGPGGVSLEASEAEATSWMQTPAGLSVSRFEVAYLAQPGGGRLRAQVDSEPPLMVATAADTVGPGLLRLDVPDGPHRLTLTVVGDGPVRILGVTLDRDVPGVVVDGMGVGGSTAGDWAKWSEPLMAPFLARRPPELVLLEYGTNDSVANKMTPDRYRAELRAQLATMRRLAPDAACVLVTPADRGQKVIGTTFAVWSPLDWVIQIQEEEAPIFGCATWSMRRAMGGVGAAFAWRLAQPPLMGADLLHPTPAGYEELGRRLAAALMAAGG
jgi:lysophospholipase L1-like esterase